MNSQAESLLGYRREALVGTPMTRIVPPRPTSHPMGPRTECSVVRADGSEVPVEITLSSLETPGGLWVSAAIRDLTERRRAEESIARMAAVVESSSEAIYSTAPDGTICTWNPAAEALFGYPREAVLGRPGSILFTDGAGGHEPGTFDVVGLRQDGGQLELSVTISPVHDRSGTTIGTATIARDMGPVRAAERTLRRSLDEKVVLVREVQHRVKNNLQVVSSLLKLHAEGLTDERARAAFRDAGDRVRTMALLHDILHRSPDVSSVDMADVAQALVDASNRGGVGRGPVQVILDGDGVRLPLDLALPCAMVLNELVRNALDHAFQGSTPEPELRIAMQQCDGQVELTVEDNGVGLPGDVDPERANSLGLRLIRSLTRQLRGALAFAGDSGTRCTVRFSSDPDKESPSDEQDPRRRG